MHEPIYMSISDAIKHFLPFLSSVIIQNYSECHLPNLYKKTITACSHIELSLHFLLPCNARESMLIQVKNKILEGQNMQKSWQNSHATRDFR